MRKLFWLMIGLVVAGCDLNADSNAVVTENVVFISSESARFAGRIVGSDGKIDSHGFEVSQSEGFEDPIVVDNGVPEALGLYLGLLEGLIPNQQYYVRAFASGPGSMVYGSPVAFQTLSPQGTGLRPSIASVGEEVTVLVENLTSDAEIFFGDSKAEILRVDFESIITVRVPSITADVIVPVTITMRGATFDLGSFEYVIGRWRNEALAFPDDEVNIFEPVYIQNEESFVMGFGFDQRLTFNYDRLWHLDFASFEWTEIPYSGLGIREPFKVDACFGNGKISESFGEVDNNNEFYCLDNTGVTLQGTTPFSLYKAIGAKIEGDIYVYGGFKENQQLNNVVYRYSGDEWVELGLHPLIPSPSDEPYLLDTIAPPIISEIPNFVVEDRAFIIRDGIVWEFNTETLGFDEHDQSPIFNCTRGVTEVMNGKVYLGICGGDTRGFFEYDPINKIWKEKNRFPLISHRYNVASFTYDNKIYLFMNQIDGSIRIAPRGVITYSLSPDEI